MEKRFEYVVATDMKALVEELNRRANKYHFTTVYMSDGIAVIDTLISPVVLVDESDFEEVVSDSQTVNPSFA